jgi:hypothetical protein
LDESKITGRAGNNGLGTTSSGSFKARILISGPRLAIALLPTTRSLKSILAGGLSNVTTTPLAKDGSQTRRIKVARRRSVEERFMMLVLQVVEGVVDGCGGILSWRVLALLDSGRLCEKQNSLFE